MRKFMLILLVIVSCKHSANETPVGIIPRDSMINIMADIHIAEARMIQAGTRSMMRDVKSVYMQQVLTKVGVDTTRFLKSFDYYSENPEQFSVMYESVIDEISKKQALQSRKPAR